MTKGMHLEGDCNDRNSKFISGYKKKHENTQSGFLVTRLRSKYSTSRKQEYTVIATVTCSAGKDICSTWLLSDAENPRQLISYSILVAVLVLGISVFVHIPTGPCWCSALASVGASL
jgi:hypothetical protein